MSETPIERKRRKRREEYYRNIDRYKAHRVRYRPRRKELAAKYYDAISIEHKMFLSARYRAKKNGIPFTICVDDIHIPKVCPLLEIPLHSNRYGRKLTPGSPTLDRKDCGLGYTKDNIWVVSHKANRAKNNLSFPELELLVKNLKAHVE